MPGDPKPKDKKEKKPEPPKVKVAEERRGEDPKQVDLHGALAYRDVDTEEKTTVTEIFTTAHFGLRITADALSNVQDMEDAEKRRKKLYKRVKARPEAEVIPVGAKKAESDLIISKALATNTRGKTH